MRVLLAPDKFAGTLTSFEVCGALTLGWQDVAPQDVVISQPMADGGPGFLAALASARGSADGAELLTIATTGPHGRAVTAQLLVTGQPPTAYVEAAQVCGLGLAPRRRRALEATSGGLAPLLVAALDREVSRVVVGVGGTASTDGGRPVVEALAGRWPAEVELVAATDVANPLLGPAGAARSFAPQKGASDAEVHALEQRLTAWASGSDVDPNSPGAGAGGGLGYGLLRLGATRVSGADLVAATVGLEEAIAEAELVITGEGRFDFSSLRGKVVSHVSQLAVAASTPCVVVAGDSKVGHREAGAIGIDEIYTAVDAIGRPEAMSRPTHAVRQVAAAVARDWSRG